MVGGTSLTTTAKEALFTLLPSLAVIVTVWDKSAPPSDHDQVPLAFLVTVPAEADKVTVPGPVQVPVFDPVCPSLTTTVPWLALTLKLTVCPPPLANAATSASVRTPL